MDSRIRPRNNYTPKKLLQNLNYKEELVYGSLAGFSICLVGHPFDTVKTYSQVFNRGFLTAVKSIYGNGGIANFYKGIMSPLTTTTLLNAGIFTSFEVGKRVLSQLTNKSVTDLRIIGAAGFVTGVLNSFLIASIELFKIQKQIQVDKKVVTSYFDILREVRKGAGWPGVFKGTYLSMGRDSIGYMSQFMMYQVTLNYFAGGREVQDNENWHHLVAGGFAGLACWVSGYPFDTIKSIYQGESVSQRLSVFPKGDTSRIAKTVYSRSGIGGFYLGLGSIMGRAVLGNAVGFYVWNLSRNHIKL